MLVSVVALIIFNNRASAQTTLFDDTYTRANLNSGQTDVGSGINYTITTNNVTIAVTSGTFVGLPLETIMLPVPCAETPTPLACSTFQLYPLLIFNPNLSNGHFQFNVQGVAGQPTAR
jgi:hypothetical protein